MARVATERVARERAAAALLHSRAAAAAVALGKGKSEMLIDLQNELIATMSGHPTTPEPPPQARARRGRGERREVRGEHQPPTSPPDPSP